MLHFLYSITHGLFIRLRAIFGVNTVIAILLSLGSTLISIRYQWYLDFPLTIISTAIVFPIVFSINSAYKRREQALIQYGIMKSSGRSIYLSSRDWLRDSGEVAEKNVAEFKNGLKDLFLLADSLFKSSIAQSMVLEDKVYKKFSEFSKSVEGLRDRGLSGSEVSRVNAWLNRYMTAFEILKHIYQYRTPRTLRFYSQIFIYSIMVILGPYFAFLTESSDFWLVLSVPLLFSTVFTALDNIQQHLENPFDGVGEDDIKINTTKFIEFLD